MAEAQVVLIEFQVDDSQIVSAIDRLEKAGLVDSKLAGSFKQTTAEISKQSNEIKKAASSTAPLKKNLEDVNKATKQFTKDFMTGFNEGVIETLKEAGVSVEQFTDALSTGITNAEEPTESLRQRLKNLTVQIAELKLRGEDNTEQFKELVVEAGNIKDAIGDAAAEINNAGSDTRGLDNLIGAAQAVAGGFAVVQGAAALFGDESEELQETLLKVNAVMAVMQGLQQISNALEKEGALTKLANTVATKGQTAAQVLYNTVVGSSIGLMKALRIAFALTGVGAVILGITALAEWLMRASKATQQLTKDFTKFNLEIERDLENFKKNLDEVKRANEEQQADLKTRGALQSRITKENIKAMKDELVGIFEIQKGMRARKEEAERILTEIAKGEREKNKTLIEESEKTIGIFNDLGKQRLDLASNIRTQEIELEKQIKSERLQAVADSLQGRLALATRNSEQELELTKKLASAQAAIALAEAGENAEKRSLIERELKRQLNDLDFEYEKRQLENAIFSVNKRLETVKEGTKEELNLKIEQAKVEAALQIKEQGISAEKRLAIEAQLMKKIQQLRVGIFNKLSKDVLTIESAGNEARIAELKTSDEERLNLQLENIEIERVIQLAAVKGNATEEIRINAEADQKKLETKKQFIDNALEYELQMLDARGSILRSANEKIAADESKSLDKRLAAINQIAAKEIEAINKRQDALKQSFDEGLITREEFELKNEELRSKEIEAEEKAAERKKQLIKEVEEARVQFAIQSTLQVLDVLAQFGQQQTQAAQIQIDNQRAEIEQLHEAGAITEEEAAARQKKLDAEEAKLKRKQAERDKSIALFQAIINTAAAVARALATGGPILAAAVAVLGAAQIKLISSRPIPKFGHGKKSGYEGLAEIGETGPELYEQGGKLFMADKPQLVWLAAKDKVYNPTETKEMLMPVVDKQIMQWQPTIKSENVIDYDKLGKAVGKHINIPGFNIDEQGFKIWEQKGNERKNYMDKRYSSK